jgi:hypothetical protein
MTKLGDISTGKDPLNNVPRKGITEIGNKDKYQINIVPNKILNPVYPEGEGVSGGRRGTIHIRIQWNSQVRN